MNAAVPPSGHDSAALAERRWTLISMGIILMLVVLATVAGVHQAVMPQVRVETIDPRTLHVAGEFVESNLGSAVEPDGSVTVRLVGQQYSFTPQCLLVPVDTPIAFRGTSADVVHGFLVQGTDVNTMLVPGYITHITARFRTTGERMMPCHEFCGVGHQGMWARVRVIDRKAFFELTAQHHRVSCVTE